jgi:hypothetical protein
MKWMMIVLVGVAALSLLRIIMQIRKATTPVDNDWDSRFIGQLRKAGITPFEEYPVDFFFTLPTTAACDEVQALLEPEGYGCDSKPEIEGGTGFSLHAQKATRLIVPDMQALTARFRALAEEKGGSYDGWAVAKKRRGA